MVYAPLKFICIKYDCNRAIVDGCNLHISTKFTCANSEATASAFGYDELIQRHRSIGTRSLGEARAPRFCIGIKGKLAYDEDLSASVLWADIHFAALVLEYTEVADFICDFLCLCLCVFNVDTQKDEKTLSYL